MMLGKRYDVFVSYAIEDKHAVAEKIMQELSRKGFSTYYAGNELKVGDQIADVIFYGLEKSRYGIVILSPDYVRKWPVVERSRFLERELREKEGLIFPVWHMITYEEVKELYPELADRYALSTENCELHVIARQIGEEIRKKKRKTAIRILKRVAVIAAFIALFTATANTVYRRFDFSHSLPSRQLITTTVLKRIDDYQDKLDMELEEKVKQKNGKMVRVRSINDSYDRFIRMGRNVERTYSFTNGWCMLKGRNAITGEGIAVNDAPYNQHGLSMPVAWELEEKSRFRYDTAFTFLFAFSNLAKSKYTIDTIFFSGKQVHARVTYQQNIRMIYGSYQYNSLADKTRRQQLHLIGFKPTEEYVFELTNHAWNLREIK